MSTKIDANVARRLGVRRFDAAEYLRGEADIAACLKLLQPKGIHVCLPRHSETSRELVACPILFARRGLRARHFRTRLRDFLGGCQARGACACRPTRSSWSVPMNSIGWLFGLAKDWGEADYSLIIDDRCRRSAPSGPKDLLGPDTLTTCVLASENATYTSGALNAPEAR